MRDRNLKMLVEGALMVALAFVLSLVKVYQAPYGGSVTLGSMIPIILFARRYGVGPGFLVGVAYGIVDFISGPYIVHPAQVILDYPLAYGLVGLSGLPTTNAYLGSFIGVSGRLVSHFLSGIIFFAQYAQGNVYAYSFVYQLQYLVPELIITWVVMKVALGRLLEVRP